MTKKIQIRPLEDRVLVLPAPAEEKTASGIIIPDTAQKRPHQGHVVATGPGTKDTPMSVKVGDDILYGEYSGTKVNLDGQEYLIMRTSDIYGTYVQ